MRFTSECSDAIIEDRKRRKEYEIIAEIVTLVGQYITRRTDPVATREAIRRMIRRYKQA